MAITIQDAGGKPYLRFTTIDGRHAVDAFIAQKKIEVDLARSYMASAVIQDGKRHEVWHAPIGEPNDVEREMFRINARRGDPWAHVGRPNRNRD